MPRGLGLILFGGLGYLLLYASIANSGRFASHPWAGLQEDAYTGDRSTATGPAGTSTAPEPTLSTTQPGATILAGRTRAPHRRAQTGTLV
jgi:hypothetical protein